MKNEEQPQPLQNNDYELKSETIYCIQKQQAYLLCTNDQCTNFPFLCFKDQCKCHQQHPKCVKSTKKSLTIALQDKLVSYKNVQRKIKQAVQKAIDQLSSFQDLLLTQCKQKFSEFVGLTDFQKDFMKAIKLGQVEDITGKTIWSIAFNLKKSQKVTKMMEKLEEDISNTWAQFDKDLKKLHFDIKDRLEFFGSQIFQQSKVVKTRNEAKMIQSYFSSQQQRVKSSKLLYRGSDSNFSAANFHNTCNGHGQTITICQTTYGKKFGAYTPLAWNSNNSYYADSTMKSFMFSLSNNHKIVAEGTSNHQHCNPGYGPTFGSGHDLYLADSCHQNFNSYANVGSIYKHANYPSGNVQTYTLLVGSQQNYNFKVKDYQVWKVEFAV